MLRSLRHLPHCSSSFPSPPFLKHGVKQLHISWSVSLGVGVRGHHASDRTHMHPCVMSSAHRAWASLFTFSTAVHRNIWHMRMQKIAHFIQVNSGFFPPLFSLSESGMNTASYLIDSFYEGLALDHEAGDEELSLRSWRGLRTCLDSRTGSLQTPKGNLLPLHEQIPVYLITHLSVYLMFFLSLSTVVLVSL